MTPAPAIFLDAFRAYDTHGLPLSACVRACREKGVAVSIPAFVRDALRGGWTRDHALGIAREALVDEVRQPAAYIEGACAYLSRITADSIVPGDHVRGVE